VRFGLALPHYDTSLAGAPVSWDGVRRVAQAAESVGFDSVWVSDHLFLDFGKYGGSGQPEGSLECWTTLSGLAAATSRVRLGSLVLCNDFRNPGLLAKMAATLDVLSGGRVDVGMGAGWYEPEYVAAGISFDPPGVRIDRLGEAAMIVRRLLDGEELDFDGDHYRMKGAVCRPRPVQDPRPPVWIGGKGDRLLDVVARTADGWNFSWLADIENYAGRAEAADRACERHERDPASLRRSVGAYALVGRDAGDARRRFERLVERSPGGVFRPFEDAGAVSFERYKEQRIAGTAGEVIDRLGRLVDLGVEEVIVGLGAVPFQVADEEDVELFGEAVVPALR
jgi:probable F420-dependent oxidoreductase